MRRFLALTVLLHYLSALLACHFVPPVQVISQEHPYVHGEHCQQNNYLFLDCWDKCNGQKMEAAMPKVPLDQAVLLLASLDLHFTPSVLSVGTPLIDASSSRQSSLSLPSYAEGFSQRVGPPPKFS